MRKTLLILTAVLLTTLAGRAQTTIKVVHSGCFNTNVEELVIDENNQMTLTTDLSNVKEEFRTRTSLADKTTLSLVSDLLDQVQTIKYMGLCTSTKTISITQDGITKTFKADGCGMTPQIDNLLNDLFAYKKVHFQKNGAPSM